VLAVIAPNAGEPAFEVAAVQELVDHLRDDGAQEPIAGLVTFLVAGEEVVEMPRQALPEWRLPGPARTIDLLHHAAQCRKEGVSSNGTPHKIVGEK
jgi:hypothetical protein